MITTFKTYLYLKKTVSTADVYEAVKKWRLASKNSAEDIKSHLQDYSINQDGENTLNRFKAKNESSIEMKHIFTKDGEYWAFYLMEPQKSLGGQWNTYIIYSREYGKNILTFETTFDGTITKSIPRNKPGFFEKYLDDLIDYEASHISKIVFPVNESVLPHLVDSMVNKRVVKKPFVYISYPHVDFDIESLAKKLYCMANVYVESDKTFSLLLKEQTCGANVYNGAIGIYYGNNKHFRFLPGKNVTVEDVYRKIAEITAIKPFPHGYTWFEISQIESTQKQKKLEAAYQQLSNDSERKIAALVQSKESKELLIENLRSQISDQEGLIQNLQEQIREKEANIRNVEKELKRKSDEHDQYLEEFGSHEEEIQHLKEEISVYKQKFLEKQENENCFELAIPCTEKSLFPNEIEDFLKGLFCKAVDKETAHNGSRKYHVLENVKKQIQDWVFEASESYKKYDECEKEFKKPHKSLDEVLAVLVKYGFIDKTEKGHPKMTYHNDDRYRITIPKSPSDSRSMKNTIKDAGKICFLKPDS